MLGALTAVDDGVDGVDVVERIVEDGGDDAGGPVRRRGDDPSPRGVLLVDGHRDEVDPFEVELRVPVGVLGLELEVPVMGPPAHLEPTGQVARAVEGVRRALLHDRVDVEEPVADLLVLPHRLLVREHHLGDREPMHPTLLEEVGGGMERVRQLFAGGFEFGVDDRLGDGELRVLVGVRRIVELIVELLVRVLDEASGLPRRGGPDDTADRRLDRLGGLLLLDELRLRGDEAAAYGVVRLLGQGLSRLVEGGQGHGVRVPGQDGQGPFDHVSLCEGKFDAVAGGIAEDDLPGLGHARAPRGELVAVDGVGTAPLEAEEDRAKVP